MRSTHRTCADRCASADNLTPTLTTRGIVLGTSCARANSFQEELASGRVYACSLFPCRARRRSAPVASVGMKPQFSRLPSTSPPNLKRFLPSIWIRSTYAASPLGMAASTTMSLADPLPRAEKSRKRARRSKSPSTFTLAVRAPTASQAFSASAIFTHRPSDPPLTSRFPLCAPKMFQGRPTSGFEKSARKATGALSASSEPELAAGVAVGFAGPAVVPACVASGEPGERAFDDDAPPHAQRANVERVNTWRALIGPILIDSPAARKSYLPTLMAFPDTTLASGEHSQTMTSATSSGLLQPSKFASGIPRRLAGVSMTSGSTAFTRTPFGFHSRAALRASVTHAALDAA